MNSFEKMAIASKVEGMEVKLGNFWKRDEAKYFESQGYTVNQIKQATCNIIHAFLLSLLDGCQVYDIFGNKVFLVRDVERFLEGRTDTKKRQCLQALKNGIIEKQGAYYVID